MRITVTLLLFVLSALPLCAQGQSELLNGISVIVNNDVITEQEIGEGLMQLMQQYRGQPQVMEQKFREIRAARVEQLVQNQLILAEFKSLGYNLPESFIDDAVNERMKERFGDSVTMMKTLQRNGQTREQFRRDVREQIIVGQLRHMNVNSTKIVISPARIEAYYQANLKQYQLGDQVKLRMISINQAPGAEKGSAKKLAEEIHTKIREGIPFAEMATVNSDGSSRTTGGDRGWVDRNFLKKELSDVAFSLKPGELSQVIDLPEAAYILMVEEVRISYTKPLAEVRDEIERELQATEYGRLQKKWIDKLKAKNFVRYF